MKVGGQNFPQFGLIGWSKDGYFFYRIIFSNGGIGQKSYMMQF